MISGIMYSIWKYNEKILIKLASELPKLFNTIRQCIKPHTERTTQFFLISLRCQIEVNPKSLTAFLCKVSTRYLETAFSGRLCKFANEIFSNKVFMFKRLGFALMKAKC